jgi:hypothetical protein
MVSTESSNGVSPDPYYAKSVIIMTEDDDDAVVPIRGLARVPFQFPFILHHVIDQMLYTG